MLEDDSTILASSSGQVLSILFKVPSFIHRLNLTLFNGISSPVLAINFEVFSSTFYSFSSFLSFYFTRPEYHFLSVCQAL